MADAGGPREAAPERLLTVPEAAARLSIPPSYAYELIRIGRLEACRIGPKYVRVHPDVIAKILDEGLSPQYSRGRDGQGAARVAREANAGGVRRGARHPHEHARQIRARRPQADPGDSGAARAVSGG